MKTCCIKNCCSQSYTGCGVSFHKFPKNYDIARQWGAAIGHNVPKSAVVCSRHFVCDDFHIADSIRIKRLKTNAVPSIFPVDKSKQITVLSNIQVLPPCQPSASTSQETTSFSNSSYCETSKLTSLHPPPAKKPCTDHDITSRQADTATQTSTILPSRSTEEALKRKVKILNQRLKRRERKIDSLKSILNILKNKCNNHDEVTQMVENNFIDIYKNFNTDKSNKRIRYSDEVKEFALSLYYYSSKAYMFLRNHIALPHPVTLRRLLSTHDCNVGFLTEVFEYLKQNISDYDLHDVALIYDAMSIKNEPAYEKHQDKWWGYVDLAGIVPVDSSCLATEAFVLQIVSFKRRFKCPIAYFLITKISANVQCQLILTAIRLLFDIGITVRSLTSDGTEANISCYRNLGCKFTWPDMVTHFKHPCSDTQIHCILDPPHMLKLCRNMFAEMNLTSEQGTIEFKFVRELHAIQNAEGLKLANKINAVHVNFFRKKMNVKLAGQTLSSSVANAIDFLRISGNEKFKDSEATTEYIRHVDRLFDVLNAKSPIGKGFKSPLRLSNEAYWSDILVQSREYFSKLKINGQNILSHRRKTGPLGFIVDTFSVKNLALDLLHGDHPLEYFLPYKFSQDHLEMFFSCVRSQGGANNNPNALQFRYALRKLLYRNSVKPSLNANCTDDDFELSPILEFRSSKRNLTTHSNTSESEENLESAQETVLMSHLDTNNMSDYKMNILYYITGHIASKILKKISCQHCIDALLVCKQHSDHSYYIDITTFSSFTTFVDRGGLKYASKFAFEVVKYAEKLFLADASKPDLKISKMKILWCVKQYFSTKLATLFYPPHPTQTANEEPHELQMIKALAVSYLNMRILHHAKTLSLKNIGNKIGMRQKLNKVILFSHV